MIPWHEKIAKIAHHTEAGVISEHEALAEVADVLADWHDDYAKRREQVQPMVEHVKGHAHAHYNDGGWDVVVECWYDAHIADRLLAMGAPTRQAAIEAFAPLVDAWADRQADARNSAF